MNQPMPRSSGISSGVPHTRQITAEQSPQVSGSSTSRAQLGQYRSGECAEPLVGSGVWAICSGDCSRWVSGKTIRRAKTTTKADFPLQNSTLNSASDWIAAKRFAPPELGGSNRHATGRTLPSRACRVFNAFRGRRKYLRTTAQAGRSVPAWLAASATQSFPRRRRLCPRC